jgi:hypothetical protein
VNGHRNSSFQNSSALGPLINYLPFGGAPTCLQILLISPGTAVAAESNLRARRITRQPNPDPQAKYRETSRRIQVGHAIGIDVEAGEERSSRRSISSGYFFTHMHTVSSFLLLAFTCCLCDCLFFCDPAYHAIFAL